MKREWTCPHGVGTARGDCDVCNENIRDRTDRDAMTGDERAEEVRALLHEPNAYRVGDIHERLEALVGRPVWTHEFATDTRLMEEARGALPHPDNPAQHALDSLTALMDGKPVYVVKADR